MAQAISFALASLCSNQNFSSSALFFFFFLGTLVPSAGAPEVAETGTGSSATTSGSAIGLSACATSSWVSSEGVSSFDLSLLLFFFFFFFLGGLAALSWSRGSTTSSSASQGCFLPWLKASGSGSDGLVRVPSPSGSLGNFAGSPGEVPHQNRALLRQSGGSSWPGLLPQTPFPMLSLVDPAFRREGGHPLSWRCRASSRNDSYWLQEWF